MNVYIQKLTLQLRRSVEEIRFADFNYFYGEMGAGKSSVLRLIDFCLGGNIVLTPVLQSEFVFASINVIVSGTTVSISRQRDSSKVLAAWSNGKDELQVLLPVRQATGEVIVNTGIEVLSDLFFYLSDLPIPRVRRGKREDSDSARLSLRDLLWYCYLDQDSMDNSFFRLDDSNVFIQNKSKDVLRYIVGFHQEKVAELETRLQELRLQRAAMCDAVEVLLNALKQVGIENEGDIEDRVDKLTPRLEAVQGRVALIKKNVSRDVEHAADVLRTQARNVSGELESLEEAVASIERVIAEDERHRNEILSLSLKFQRTRSARAVLNGVSFESCPRCTQALPQRAEGECVVCGQGDTEPESQSLNVDVISQDITDRLKELNESITLHKTQIDRINRQITLTRREKSQVDSRLSEVMRDYDSAYLSQALELEYERASLEQELFQLKRFTSLPSKAEEMREAAVRFQIEESTVREELKEARKEAEKDTTNLRRLEYLFLDCLVRAKVTGFSSSQKVEIRAPRFLPEVVTKETGDLVVDSYANIGSGGKKTLFKCCFALAIHRLSAEVGANLPSVLILDTPMKNISTQENTEQFESFNRLLYELASTEFLGTQIIVVDNEFFPPDSYELPYSLFVRHFTLTDEKALPLVSYVRES